ncbi:hypothetical protein Ae201684P_022287 [Aphanomyces euteiches]|nr:hypothetical protein Ae201684P_022287 [Aphanomyces euteiches]
MVLEGIATSLVHTFCSRFVKDFKKENLHIGLNGEVELSHVELKLEEIFPLQLPIEPKSVYIGHIRSNFIASQFSTQPLHVQLSDVVVLVGTPHAPATDLEALDAAQQAKIDWMEQLLRGQWLEVKEPVNGPPKQTSEMPTWLSYLRDAFLSLERVHIRLEDASTCRSVGVFWENLIVHPANVAHDSNGFEKTIEVTNASLYVVQGEAYLSAPRVPTTASGLALAPSQYVLSPFSAIGHVNGQPNSTVQATIQIPELHVHLPWNHLKSLCALLQSVDTFVRSSLYRRFRPSSKRRGGWRAWWQYAIFAVLLELQDPIMRRPTWKLTINLALVGLQYTALRRRLRTHLRRVPMNKDDYFLHYREELKDKPSTSTSPFSMHLTSGLGSVDTTVTSFGASIFAGVYNLGSKWKMNIQDSKPSNPVDEATLLQQLWARQLYLDACFRPVVVAKLRLLAVQQNRKRDEAQNIRSQTYNKATGVLTVTIVQAHLNLSRINKWPLPSELLLSVKLKVGAQGVEYVGKPEPCSPPLASTCCTCVGLPDTSDGVCTFGQTYEFHLRGTPDEDYLYITIQDRWAFPYLQQFSTKAKLFLAACTIAPQSNNDVAFDEAKGHLRVLTNFSKHSCECSTAPSTSESMYRSLFPQLYELKHSYISWFNPDASTGEKQNSTTLTLSQLSLESTVVLHIQFGPAIASSMHIQLVHLAVVFEKSLDIKQSPIIRGTVDAVIVYRDQTSQPCVVSTGVTPAIEFKTTDSPRSISNQIQVGSMNITLSIPGLVQYYTSVLRWKNQVLDLLALLYAPIYGPFGIWIAPPQDPNPSSICGPTAITTTIHSAGQTIFLDELGTWILPTAVIEMVTKNNASTISIGDTKVASLYWNAWESFRRHLDAAMTAEDITESSMTLTETPKPVLILLTQGIVVLKHHTNRGKPQERVLWLHRASLMLGKSRYDPAPNATA